jgi:hypothetical protein
VHLRSKIHRRRLKELRTAPYTQAEADAAAGMGQFVAAKKMDVPRLLGAAAHAALAMLRSEGPAAPPAPDMAGESEASEEDEGM